MKFTTLEKIARDLNTKIIYKKFSYWDCVPHIKNTAICFDVSGNNSYSIYRDEEGFPKFVTKDYIKSAVNSNSNSLGSINCDYYGFCGKKKYEKFDE